jgi:hypothetical protein
LLVLLEAWWIPSLEQHFSFQVKVLFLYKIWHQNINAAYLCFTLGRLTFMCGWRKVLFCFVLGVDKQTGCIVEHAGKGIRHVSGVQILDNHSVNLLSTVVMGLMMPRVANLLWPWLVFLVEEDVICVWFKCSGCADRTVKLISDVSVFLETCI